MQDGDVVRFLHLSPKFDNAVTLRGNVAVPGRYPWREGMRVKDLIPNRESLVPYEYWKRQNLLARNPAGQSFQLAEDAQRLRSGNGAPDFTGRQANANGPGRNATAGTPERQNTARPAGNNSNNNSPDDNSRPLVSRNEEQRLKQEELKNEIQRSVAEINWEYAVVQRMNPDDLTFHLLPFNLGKAIEGDDSQNLTLEAGDVVTIFSQADMQVPIAQQNKFVRLEGEFFTAGVYQVQPGEKLRHLISRSGGVTPQAYLYGAEFTRDSAREDQQKRLDEYINDLEKSVERNAAGQRGLSAEEAAAERGAVEGQRRLLDRLRQLKATGRIVLELKPTTSSLDQLPDLVLEDGDRLFIPFRPATVNVIGSVYNSNSFIYKPGKTVGDYLRLAGGTTKNGDKGRTFVIRADGSTVSRQAHTRFYLSSFDSLRLMPEDTIVVPEKLDKGTAIRGFRDWTQIISQFVIGAAAAKVLFP